MVRQGQALLTVSHSHPESLKDTGCKNLRSLRLVHKSKISCPQHTQSQETAGEDGGPSEKRHTGGWGGAGTRPGENRQRRDQRGRDSRKRQPETLPPNDQRGPGQSEETARDSQRKTGA